MRPPPPGLLRYNAPGAAMRRGGARQVIVGTGCDLTPADRLRQACQRHPRLLLRLFSPEERARADVSDDGVRWDRLAGAFAAKEAAMKALGTGMRVPFSDIEVRHDPLGKPLLALSGRAQEVAAELGAARWHLSISHAGGFALATVIAEDDARG